MRYSRMLEESSFANRKADYFWLLFLSSVMLLVSIRFSDLIRRLLELTDFALAGVSSCQPPLPVLVPCFRTNIRVVTKAPVYSDISVRPHHYQRTVPSLCSCCLLLGTERIMGPCRGRSSGMRCGAYWLVYERCVDTRDGGW